MLPTVPFGILPLICNLSSMWTSIHNSSTLSWSLNCHKNNITTWTILSNYAFTLGESPWKLCRLASGRFGQSHCLPHISKPQIPLSINFLTYYQDLVPSRYFPLANEVGSPKQLQKHITSLYEFLWYIVIYASHWCLWTPQLSHLNKYWERYTLFGPWQSWAPPPIHYCPGSLPHSNCHIFKLTTPIKMFLKFLQFGHHNLHIVVVLTLVKINLWRWKAFLRPDAFTCTVMIWANFPIAP